MAERITLTGLAPAGLLADLHGLGLYAPFHAAFQGNGVVADRSDEIGIIITVIGARPEVKDKLADLLARCLTQIDAEARRAADGFDPDHLDAAREESRQNCARLARRRDAAE